VHGECIRAVGRRGKHGSRRLRDEPAAAQPQNPTPWITRRIPTTRSTGS
jgi:hypothetical protein